MRKKRSQAAVSVEWVESEREPVIAARGVCARALRLYIRPLSIGPPLGGAGDTVGQNRSWIELYRHDVLGLLRQCCVYSAAKMPSP
eukprot:2040945-Rhodomonas_salina.4